MSEFSVLLVTSLKFLFDDAWIEKPPAVSLVCQPNSPPFLLDGFWHDCSGPLRESGDTKHWYAAFVASLSGLLRFRAQQHCLQICCNRLLGVRKPWFLYPSVCRVSTSLIWQIERLRKEQWARSRRSTVRLLSVALIAKKAVLQQRRQWSLSLIWLCWRCLVLLCGSSCLRNRRRHGR